MRNKRRRHGWPWGSAARNRQVRPRHRRMEIHQLDVKLDSRKARRVRRHRKASWLIKALAIVVMVLSATASVRWVYQQIFFENSEFVLNRLQVHSDGVLTEGELATAAGIELGMNLMEIDLDEVRERLAKLPMVIRSEVIRELPDRLEIRVKERVPVAWLSCPPHGVRPKNTAHGFLVDEEGQVFRCHKLIGRFMALPVIETMRMPKPAEGTRIEFAPVQEAISLIQRSNALFERDRLEVSEVRLRNEWSLNVHYNNQMTVVFGSGDTERGLEDLRWIVSHAHSAHKELATVNLIPTRNIPVTFFNPPEQRAVPIAQDKLDGAGPSKKVRPVSGEFESAPGEGWKQDLHLILHRD